MFVNEFDLDSASCTTGFYKLQPTQLRLAYISCLTDMFDGLLIL